jgi:hypothetical protein
MTQNNIIGSPVSSETWQTKSNGTPEMLSSSVSEYGVTYNGDIKPIRTYGLEADKPISQNNIGTFNPNQLIRDPNYIKPQSEVSYNSNGQAVESKDLIGNRISTTLYYYNHTLPIASVANASYKEVAYTSFEKELGSYYPDPNCGFTNDSKWEASGNVTFPEDASAPTGKSCAQLNLGGAINVRSCDFLPITKDYKLTFWASSPSFTLLDGSIPFTKGIIVNGWTYYEFNLPPGTPLPYISGTCKIDEIRLYPKNASMATTTYTPGVGKTSECDINNRITYYEYDGLNRISKVFDDHHNIIKTYEYHYKNN